MPEEKTTFDIRSVLQKVRITRDLAIKLALGVGLTVSLAMMFPRGESIELDYKIGAVWTQKDLIAPFSFPILRDEREYEAEVENARKRVYPVFERDPKIETQQIEALREFFGKVKAALQARDRSLQSGAARRTTAPEDSLNFAAIASRLEIPLNRTQWEILAHIAESGQLHQMEEFLAGLLRRYFIAGIIDRPKGSLQRTEIALRKGTAEEILALTRLFDQQDVVRLLEQELMGLYRSDNDTLALAYTIAVMYVAPNVKFNKAATEVASAAAVEAVPRTTGFVQENERVVSKHERITPDIKLKLESLARAKAERGGEYDQPIQVIGIILHVVVVVALYGIYLYLFRKRIWASNRLLSMIGLLILMQGFFAYVTRELNVTVPIEYLILVPAASMLLTIAFDSRVAFYGTVIISFLVAGVRGNDYSIALASLVAGALAVYTVRDMKNRTQIFTSLGFIFLGYALTILALGFERFESANVIILQLVFALANAIISPVLTYGLLIFFERVFRITTDLTLIELAHFNHPLLRMLSEKAPGTYHHSMTMASLAEAAALAVGANDVVARVGAYFHDIGKIEKPTYFVENQKGARNRHDKLSPRMSSLIIAAHVKDGVALGKEYDLPDVVLDFIPMHHGTTRIEYFYNKALKLAESSPDETKVDEIKESDYRYPGPKPQTKETGILMLADAIEATARTLEDPSPQKLEALIEEIIKKRFEEGELDECPLTLKDLTKIKSAFLGVLVGIYHSRVKYPSGDKPEKKKTRDRQPSAQSAPQEATDANGFAPRPNPAESAPPSPERLTRTIREIEKE